MPEFTNILTQGTQILLDALLTDRATHTQDIIQAWANPGINMPDKLLQPLINTITRKYMQQKPSPC